MKKFISYITLFTLLSVLITGCGSKAKDSGNQQNGSGMPPNGQGQFARADLSGQVDSINGNDVTIKLMKMNINRPNGRQNGNRRQNGGPNPNGEENQNRGANRGANGNGWQRRAPEFTGETKTIALTSDIPITTFTRGANGPENKTITVNDIKQGDVLQVWYADKDKGTISRVSVMNYGQNPQNQQSEQSQQDQQN